MANIITAGIHSSHKEHAIIFNTIINLDEPTQGLKITNAKKLLSLLSDATQFEFKSKCYYCAEETNIAYYLKVNNTTLVFSDLLSHMILEHDYHLPANFALSLYEKINPYVGAKNCDIDLSNSAPSLLIKKALLKDKNNYEVMAENIIISDHSSLIISGTKKYINIEMPKTLQVVKYCADCVRLLFDFATQETPRHSPCMWNGEIFIKINSTAPDILCDCGLNNKIKCKCILVNSTNKPKASGFNRGVDILQETINKHYRIYRPAYPMCRVVVENEKINVYNCEKCLIDHDD